MTAVPELFSTVAKSTVIERQGSVTVISNWTGVVTLKVEEPAGPLLEIVIVLVKLTVWVP